MALKDVRIHQIKHAKNLISDVTIIDVFRDVGAVIMIMIVAMIPMNSIALTNNIETARNPNFLAPMECVFTFPNFVMGYKIVWIPQMRCTVTRRVILTLNFNATAQPIVFLSHGNVMGK